MKLIEIINGTYGHRPAGSRYIEPKQAGDPPFEIEDHKAERLVSLGIASIVDNSPLGGIIQPKEPANLVATTIKSGNGTEMGANLLNNKDSTDGIGDAQERPAYSINMKVAELRELMEEYGLIYKVGATKADMVATLDEYFSSGEDDNSESPPDVTAEEPVI